MEKLTNSGYTLVVEPTRSADELDVGSKGKNRKQENRCPISKNFEFYSRSYKNIWKVLKMNVS